MSHIQNLLEQYNIIQYALVSNRYNTLRYMCCNNSKVTKYTNHVKYNSYIIT